MIDRELTVDSVAQNQHLVEFKSFRFLFMLVKIDLKLVFIELYTKIILNVVEKKDIVLKSR